MTRIVVGSIVVYEGPGGNMVIDTVHQGGVDRIVGGRHVACIERADVGDLVEAITTYWLQKGGKP